jgi:hypothetical protein
MRPKSQKHAIQAKTVKNLGLITKDMQFKTELYANIEVSTITQHSINTDTTEIKTGLPMGYP